MEGFVQSTGRKGAVPGSAGITNRGGNARDEINAHRISPSKESEY